MVATLLFMQDDQDTLASPPSPPANAMEAQKVALNAQQQAEAAQREALAMQAAEAGLPPLKTDIENLRAAAADVKESTEKLIEHTRQ